MTVSLTSLANNQSFGTLLQRVDDVVAVFASNAVTTDSTSGGGITTGNGFVNGNFGSVILFAGNSVSNVFSNSTSLNASWGLSGNSSGFYVNNGVYSNSFTTSQSVVNTSGVFSVNSLNSNNLYIANNLVVNGVTTYAQALHVNSNVNTATLNALSSIFVGVTFSITPTTLTVGNTTLNSSAFAGDKVIVGNSTTNTILTGNMISTTWGIVGNGSGFYSSNSFNSNSLITPVTTINATGTYTNLITCNNFVSNLTTANSTGLYANLATINNFSCGLTTGNATALYANNVIIGSVTVANTLGLYTNTITTNNISVGGSIIGNATALYSSAHYASLLQVNNAVTANSLGLYANVINANNITLGNSSVNNFSNSTVLWLSNSSYTLFGVNTSGIYTNGSMTVYGSLYISGNTTTSGTTIGTGDYIPSTNSYGLGNTTNRWTIWGMSANLLANCTVGNTIIVGTATLNSTAYTGQANNALYIGGLIASNVISNAQLSGNLAWYSNNTQLSSNLSNYVLVNTAIAVGNTTSNVFVNSTIIAIGNSGTSVTLNSTAYTGQANNALYIGGLIASNVISNAQLSSNLVNYPNTIQLAANMATVIPTAGLPTYLSSYTGNLTANIISGTLVYAGNGSVNVVANSTSLKVSNSTSSITLVAPTAAQVSNGQYFLDSGGAWVLNPTTSGSVITTGTSTQNIDSFSIAANYAAEYLIVVGDNSAGANSRYITSILLTHDGNNAYITEWGSITTNSYLGAFESTTGGGLCTLNFTPTSVNTTIRFTRTLI